MPEKLKASSLRRTVVLNDKTILTIGRIAKEKYESLPWYATIDKQEIIDALLNLGITDVANELISKT